MKRQLFALMVNLVSVVTLSAQSLPNLKLQDQKGNEFSTEKLVDGKTPFVVTFWATTCKPCIKEIDTFVENLEDWSDELDFRIIAVSTDDSRSVSRARAMAVGRGWNVLTLLYDENKEFARALNVVNTPQLYVFSPDGKLVFSHTGYNPGDEAETFKALQKAAKK